MNEAAVSAILIVFGGGYILLESYLLFGSEVLVIAYFIGWFALIVLTCFVGRSALRSFRGEDMEAVLGQKGGA